VIELSFLLMDEGFVSNKYAKEEEK